MSWLDELMLATNESEAPERYFWWSGLAAISAVVRKNVWIDRGGYYNLYPNIYVALVSSRSGARKGLPISICKRLLEGRARVISGANSIQGLTQELSQQKTLKNGSIIQDAHGILLSGEFDTFLNEDPKAFSTLTELYNTHENEPEWTKRLKGSNLEVLKNPCLTMLVASNEALFDGLMKQKDIEGGFIGRTFMVYEQKDKRVNPLLDKPVHQLDIPHLAERLEKISKIKGEFIWSEKAKSWYRDWYHKLKGQDTDDRTGSVNRLGDGVIKVAMLLSLADKDFLTIEKDNIMVAAQCCLQCTHSAIHMMPATTQQNGTNPTSIVIKAILSSTDFTISRQKLLSTVLRRVGGAAVLDKIIEPLISNGWIRLFRDDSKQPCYKLTDHGYLEFYQNNLTVEDTRL